MALITITDTGDTASNGITAANAHVFIGYLAELIKQLALLTITAPVVLPPTETVPEPPTEIARDTP